MRKFWQPAFYFFTYLTLFLLPWQTRWIFFEQPLNGQVWEYGRLGLYSSMLTLLAAVICFYLAKIKTGEKKIILQYWPLWLLFSYLFITSWLSELPIVSLYYFNLIVLAFLFSFLLQYLEIKKILVVLSLSGLLQGLLALWQLITQQVVANKWLGLAEHLPNNLGTSVVELDSLRWLRAYGSLPHPNLLGGFLVICILAALSWWLLTYQRAAQDYWQEAKKFVWEIILIIFSLTVMTFGLLASFSRSAILSLFLVIILGIIWYGYKRIKLSWIVLLKYLAILFLCLTAFNFILPGSLTARWQLQNRLEVKSVNERVLSWQQLDWQNAKQLFFGQGLGLNSYVNNYKLPPYAVQPIHNYWLLALAEIGVIGVILLLLVFWQVFRRLKNAQAIASLLVWLAIGLFDHYWWTSWTGWLILAIILAHNQPKLT